MSKFLSYLFLLIMLFSITLQGISIDRGLQNTVFIESQEEESSPENYNNLFFSESKTAFHIYETRLQKAKFASCVQMVCKEDFSSDIESPPEFI